MPDPDQIPRPSKTITVFTNAEKTSSGNPHTSVLNLDGVRPIIVLQKATRINAGTRTLGSVNVGFSNASNAIDNDLDSAATTGAFNATTKRLSINFSTSVLRKIWIKVTFFGNAGTATGVLEYSNDDSTWVNPETIFTQTLTGVNSAYEVLAVAQTFQYARFSITHAGGGQISEFSIHEMWEDQTGLGKSDLSLEVFDSVNNQWHELVPTAAFTQMNSYQTSVIDMREFGPTIRREDATSQIGYLLPYGENILRINMTVIGKVNTAVTVIAI